MRGSGIDQGPGSIAVHDLDKRYGAVTAVDRVSFEVASGECLALLGPSGSGKTTVLMSIAGFEFPDQGRVLIGVTVLFVTHDQTEALTMADRVAVLDQGRLQQLGSPRELYEAPATPFVAGFVGETNFCAGIVRDAAGMGERVSATLDGGMAMDAIAAMPLPTGARISVALRPERLRVESGGPENGENHMPATVAEAVYAGNATTLLLDAAGGPSAARAHLRRRRHARAAAQRGRHPHLAARRRARLREQRAIMGA